MVAGVIRSGGRILLTRRPDHAHLGGLWEFPGGKIEGIETAEAALVREIREELGLRVRVGTLRLEQLHSYPDRTVHLRFFECVVVEGTPLCKAGTEMVWVTPAELELYAMPEGNRSLIRMLTSE